MNEEHKTYYLKEIIKRVTQALDDNPATVTVDVKYTLQDGQERQRSVVFLPRAAHEEMKEWLLSQVTIEEPTITKEYGNGYTRFTVNAGTKE